MDEYDKELKQEIQEEIKEIEETKDNEKTIDTSLEMIESMTKIKSEIIKRIGDDFKFAKSNAGGLNQKEVDVIVELIHDCFDVITIAKRMKRSIKKWKIVNGKYIEIKPDFMSQEWKTLEEEIITLFLTRPLGLAIMNFNVKGNSIVDGILGINAPEEEGIESKLDEMREKMKGMVEKK